MAPGRCSSAYSFVTNLLSMMAVSSGVRLPVADLGEDLRERHLFMTHYLNERVVVERLPHDLTAEILPTPLVDGGLTHGRQLSQIAAKHDVHPSERTVVFVKNVLESGIDLLK